MGRKLYLDICDYSKKPLYPIFDSDIRIPGEASNIIVATERNGWRELSFVMPTVCHTENGDEDNAALQYLKSDYLIRLRDDYETDWFIISNPRIQHNGYLKQINVTAGHVSQLLKVKNLGLEFNDQEGGNVGTASELAETILEGTGWQLGYVYDFREKRTNEVKVRSLKASAKTGAFKLMSTMCDLFEAKPVYHGDTKTVDIIPINPFTSYEPGMLPDLSLANGVIELHYGRNLKNVTRSMNSENIVTRLYAYGSFGNKTEGYCAIDECLHTEYRFTLDEGLEQGHEYYFTVKDDENVDITYSFVADNNAPAGTILVFSIMDPASMMYIWNETNQVAYPVTKRNDSVNQYTLDERAGEPESVEARNWFSFLMDFDYYRQTGMFSDEMIQYLAIYQRGAIDRYQETLDAANEFTERQTELARIVGSIDLCKLSVTTVTSGADEDDGYVKLLLNTDSYPNGVIYRSDYDKNKKKQFKWRYATQLNGDGDPIDSSCLMYIIKKKDTVTGNALNDYKYIRAWLRRTDDEDDPSEITLWLSTDDLIELNNGFRTVVPSNYDFFLISTDTNGYLGSLESQDEAAKASDDTTTFITEEHPIIFTREEPEVIGIGGVNRFGWLWKYNYSINRDDTVDPEPSQLYFCYQSDGDDEWKLVHYTNDISNETVSSGEYWYDWERGILSRYTNGVWVQLIENKGGTLVGNYDSETGEIISGGTTDDQKIGSTFGAVHLRGMQRDRYWQGMPERLIYTVPENQTLLKGNYAISDGYSNYLVFSTKAPLSTGDTLTYNYTAENPQISGYVVQRTQNVDMTIDNVKTYPYDAVYTHPSNILKGLVLQAGTIDSNNNNIDDLDGVRLQGFAKVIPETLYQMYNFSNQEHSYYGYITVHFYTSNKTFISGASVTPTSQRAQFTTPKNAHYIRFSISKYDSEHNNVTLEEFENYIQTYYIAAVNRDRIVIDDINYTVLTGAEPDGESIGIIQMIKKFVQYADLTYSDSYGTMVQKQAEIKNLENTMIELMGDLFREGYWQDNNYVDGDEQKLYDDAMENIKKIAFPETTYEIGFIDLYDSNGNDLDYAADPDTLTVPWPDISISSAVHLVDEEIGINTWGFIDKINKCYDKPWATTISVNTNLTTMAQHSFSDVMTHIANVANTVKANVTKYDIITSNAVTYQQYDDLLSNLVTLTKVTERVGGRIDTMENAISGHESNIIQAANMIATEVSRAVGEEQKLSSRIQQTEEGIVMTVTNQVTNAMADIGIDAYSVQILCPEGSFITSNVNELTLNAAVYLGISQENLVDKETMSEDEITVPHSALSWHKREYDQQGQETWTLIQSGVSSITVTAQQVGDQAMFRLTANVDGYNRYAYFTAANIAKVNQLELYVSSSLPEVQTLSYGASGTYTPDWSNALNPLVLTPQLYFNGTFVNNYDVDEFEWQKIPNNGTIRSIQASDGEIMTDVDQYDNKPQGYGTLTVNQNVNSGSLTYRCTASYQGNTIRAEKTFTLVQTEFSTESCSITGMQVLKHDNANQPLYPSVDLTATTKGCSVVNWWYKDATKSGDAAWTAYPGLTEIQRTATILTVAATDQVFYNDVATIKVTTVNANGSAGPFDIFSVYKIYDGTDGTNGVDGIDGTNAPLAFLTNDNITFIGDQNGRVSANSSTTLNIVAYLGVQKVIPVLASQGAIVQGSGNYFDITTANANANSEIPVTISVRTDSNLGGTGDQHGEIQIYITYPVNTTLTVHWNKLNTGTQGVGVRSMTTYYTKSPRESTPNADRYLINTLNGKQTIAVLGGIDTNWDGTVDSNDDVGNPRLGDMILGASSIWTTEIPNIDQVERYLWAYDVIEYTDGSQPTMTAPRIAGVYGDIGDKAIVYGMYAPKGEVFKQDTDYLETVVYVYAGSEDIVPICSFDWHYYYDGQWNLVSDCHSNQNTWSLNWLRANCSGGAALRCTINCHGETYYAYCNLIDKTDNYQAIIASSAGSQITSAAGTSTLRCRLYQNGIEVDEDGNKFTYTWTRMNANGELMEETFAIGKQVVVSALRDIGSTMTFICFARAIEGGYSAQGQYTIDCSLSIIYSSDPPDNPVLNMLWMDTTDEDVNILKRWDGERFVDVNISQQQLKDINLAIQNQQSQIEQLADRISLTVEETQSARNELTGFIETTYSSDLTLTSRQIEASVTQVENSPILNGLNSFTRSVTSWMKFDINGLELGKNVYEDGELDEAESRFRARLTPTELAFMEGNEKVAYLSNKSLYITDARVVNQLNIGSNLADVNGGWYRHQMRTGGLSIEWAAEHFITYKFHASVEYINKPPQDLTIENFFAFILQRIREDGTPVISQKEWYQSTVFNDGDGQIFFPSFTFDDAGENSPTGKDYYFKIQQQAGGPFGDPTDPYTRQGVVTYDPAVYYLKVNVRYAEDNDPNYAGTGKRGLVLNSIGYKTSIDGTYKEIYDVDPDLATPWPISFTNIYSDN